MTSLHRVVVTWSGAGVVGSAVSVLHYSASDNASPPVAGILSAFQAGNGLWPDGLKITVPNSGDTIDDRTGDLTGVWSSTGGGTFSATGITFSAAGVGVCIGWTTGGIVTGASGKPHKLRGRTFLVPVGADVFDVDGTPKTEKLVFANNVASGLMAAGPLAVWHRPTAAGASDGNSYGVISYRVRDHLAFLRSRRD